MNHMNMPSGIDLTDFLTLGIMVFAIGLTGILINRKSIISVLLSVELMLLGININFVSFSAFMNDLAGQVFTIMVLTVAAAEAAIGLAILVVYFRNRSTIQIDSISQMRG